MFKHCEKNKKKSDIFVCEWLQENLEDLFILSKQGYIGSSAAVEGSRLCLPIVILAG